MRVLPLMTAVLLLAVPGASAAQDRGAPFPDHWLTADSLGALLGLSADQQAAVSGPVAEVNAVLQRATQRREELRLEFQGMPRVSQMSESERQALQARLETIRVEYEGRQAELERWLAAVRAQLTATQQTRFDALGKPRLVPQREAETGGGAP